MVVWCSKSGRELLCTAPVVDRPSLALNSFQIYSSPRRSSVKKGRHRRFEEARALKRNQDTDLEGFFEDDEDEVGEHKPEHDAWADLAEEWEQKTTADDAPKPANGDGTAAAVVDDEE